MVTKVAFDSRDAERYPPFAVCAFETTPISPRGILVIVISPSDGPIVTAGRSPIVR
jgi:hypothetical protein